MIRIEEVCEDRIYFKVPYREQFTYFRLTPKEILDSIKVLKEALFQWSKLTRKRVDDPACH